jgi:hypothetical protein
LFKFLSLYFFLPLLCSGWSFVFVYFSFFQHPGKNARSLQDEAIQIRLE